MHIMRCISKGEFAVLQEAEFIIKTIHSLDQYFEKCIQKKVEQAGVTLPQMRVIREVVVHQGISIKQLSQSLDMTQSTVSGIVERLINKGYLMKKTNPRDKRFAEIWCTENVSIFLEKNITEFVGEAVGDVFSHLPSNDLETITYGIRLLLTAVNKENKTK